MEKKELIQSLFSWNKETIIFDGKEKEIAKVYQRLCGDADVQKARTTALRYSRELRLKLKDENSDEYLAYVDGYNDLTKEELINIILLDELKSMRNKVEKELHFPEPPEPGDDDPTEKWEEYQQLMDTYEDRRLEKLNELMTKEIEVKKNELMGISQELLLRSVLGARINNLCENELQIRFLEMVTYLGTYRDKRFKNRVFESFHDFLNSPDILKNQLIEGYTSLEISSISLKGFAEVNSSEVK